MSEGPICPECIAEGVKARRDVASGATRNRCCSLQDLTVRVRYTRDMSSVRDLSGQRFGRLVVVAREGSNPAGKAVWSAVCDCGAKVSVVGSRMAVARGGIKSCGCLRTDRAREATTTHGYAFRAVGGKRHYLYTTWASAKGRCSNPNNQRWSYYGGRGIQMHAPWAESFAEFAEWILANLGERPDGCSIDRIDNDGDYAPGNVRWASRSEQRSNSRSLGQRPQPVGVRGGRQHGSRSRYQYGCRCTPCVDAASVWLKSYRARKAAAK